MRINAAPVSEIRSRQTTQQSDWANIAKFPMHKHLADDNVSAPDAFLMRTAQPCDLQVPACDAAHITITPPSLLFLNTCAMANGSACCPRHGAYRPVVHSSKWHLFGNRPYRGSLHSTPSRSLRIAGSTITAQASRRGLPPPLPPLCAGNCCVVHRTLPGRVKVVAVGWRK